MHLPKVIPGSAAVLPSYMLRCCKYHASLAHRLIVSIETYCKSEPQIAAYITG